MTRSMHLQWIAALTLMIAPVPGAASAQEEGTVTISGVFNMDYMYGETDLYYSDRDLLTVYTNGHDHTWTLTLRGTTQSHSTNGAYYGTEIHATSYELEFFGPDAALLNGIVSDHLAGKTARAYLQNTYDDLGGGFAIMHVGVGGSNGELYFYTGQEMGDFTLFPADANGFPVVTAEPFSIESDYTELGYSDMLSQTGGAIGSLAGPVTIAGSVSEPEPPLVLAVADASVLEGHRSTSKVAVSVTLSRSSNTDVTVRYATANGTALAKSDYTATSGTLTFLPGETRRTIAVSIVGDRKREPNESFSVQLSNAVGATIADGVATLTILNDD